MFDFSADSVEESVNNSLKLLGVDYIDLAQVHDIEFAPSLDIIFNETLPTLQKVCDLVCFLNQYLFVCLIIIPLVFIS